MSKLDDIIANLNKKHKTDIITKDREGVTFNIKERVPFITAPFTYLFHGGFPIHTLWEVSGVESGGKTTFCLATAGQFQRYYKKKWEDEVNELKSIDKLNKNQKARLDELLIDGYKKVVWLDSEHSMDIEWAIKNGLDVDDIIYIKPQEDSAESLLDDTIDLIRCNGVCLLVVDSVSNLTSGAALSKSLEDKTYCGISGPLTSWTGKLLPLLNKYDCTVICVNQERDVINSMFPQSRTPGGRAFKYGCHVRVAFRKGKAIDETCSEIPNKEESYYGNMSEVQILKNKITKPDRRCCKFTITYDKGIYPINDTLFMAISLGLIKKAGAWFSIVDENGEVIVHNNGDTMKWQGQANTLKYLEEHDDVYQEIYNKVMELITQE